MGKLILWNRSYKKATSEMVTAALKWIWNLMIAIILNFKAIPSMSQMKAYLVNLNLNSKRSKINSGNLLVKKIKRRRKNLPK